MNQASIERRKEIGAYLRQQRLRLDGRLIGPARDRRHVAHLTQADVAELAGVSEALVAQVESGRYPNLNERLLGKLARALGLDPHQASYLHNLLRMPIATHRAELAALTPAARSVVDAAMPVPSFIADCCFNLLYWNPTFAAMLGDFSRMPISDRNVLWSMFCDPAMRRNWIDWEGNARNLVAALGMQRSLFPHRAGEFEALITRLRVNDAQFAEWWADADPRLDPVQDKEYIHPHVGPLRIFQTVSSVMGVPDLAIVHMTPRDDETRAKFEMLAQLGPPRDMMASPRHPGTAERPAAD